MKNKRLMLIAVVMLLVLALVGCSDSPSGGADKSKNAATDEGALGDYYVKILNAEQVKSFEDIDCLRVYFEFTNNSENDTSFFVATSAKGFQNGIQMETTYIGSENGVPEDDNYLKDIKPGATIKVTEAFVCEDDSSVLVEISELFNFSSTTKLTKTFTLD